MAGVIVRLSLSAESAVIMALLAFQYYHYLYCIVCYLRVNLVVDDVAYGHFAR